MSNFSIGSVLSKLLKKFNLNVLELERLTGVPSSTIYRLLKNKDGNPTVEVLKKIASFFQITVSQLIGEDPIGARQIPLIPSKKIYNFCMGTCKDSFKFETIPIDFPLSPLSFATVAEDSFMEPFILVNSIIIIDPLKEISHKDFVLYIDEQGSLPKMRQLIKDGSDTYLKVFNENFEMKSSSRVNINEFHFIGSIVHYRTNLFNIRSGIDGLEKHLCLAKSS